MKMISRKLTIVFAFVFIMSTAVNVQIGQANTTALDNIKPGDTVYYKVSKYNFPLTDLLAGQQSSIDLSKVQLDLTGSQIGVKVMTTDSATGVYLLDVFAILGKDVVVPFPANTDPAVTGIFGDSLTVPAGVGLSIGAMLPGSNLVTVVTTGGSNGGIPVYIEPSHTSDYKSYLDSQTVSGGSLVTTDGTDTFQTVYSVTDSSGSLTITLVWFKTGNDAGFFKSFDLTGTVPNAQNQNVNVQFTFAFDHRVNNPLPTEITSGTQQLLQVENAGFDMSWDGTYFNDAFSGFNQTDYNNARSQLQGMIGKDFMKYTFGGTNGMYYKSSLDLFDPSTNGYNNAFKDVWFDGFTGTPSSYDPSCAPNCINYNSLTGILIPFLAPGVSPDWDIWQANMNTYQALSDIVTKTLTSSSVANSLGDYGLSVDTLTNLMQLRSQDQFKYFYNELNAKVSYDASQGLSDSAHRPSGFDGTEKASIDATGNVWSSYSDKGLIAGYGVQFNVTLSVTNFPLASTSSQRGSGTFTFGVVLKIRNDAFSSLPDGKNAGVGGGGLLPGVPGFEMVPVLMVLVGIPLISKRKRKNN